MSSSLKQAKQNALKNSALLDDAADDSDEEDDDLPAGAVDEHFNKFWRATEDALDAANHAWWDAANWMHHDEPTRLAITFRVAVSQGILAR